MRKFALTLIVLLALLGGPALRGQVRRQAPSGSPAPTRRLALVIGNDSYVSAPLRNARNDARSMAQALRALSFDVTTVEDGTRVAMGAALRGFAGRVTASDLALVFYAGHGVQVEGVNYLIPADFQGRSEDEVRFGAVSSGEVTRAVRGAGVAVVVLDACRDNPYSGQRSGSGGLAQLEAKGLLVAFATGAGQTAGDAPGLANGVFTSELIQLLGAPGRGLRDTFFDVQYRVQLRTGGKQFPAVYSQLVNDVVLTPAAVASAQPGPRPATAPSSADLALRAELELWDAIKNGTDPAPFADYLTRYPAGQFRVVAEARVSALRAATAPASRPPNAAAPTTAAATSRGGSLTVRTQPGSTVAVDGSAVGVTDSEGVLLLPRLQSGRHVIAVRREGFRPEERSINFGGQNDAVRVPLVALPGQLTISSTTVGATFRVDGASSYVGGISGLELPAGHHTVTATKSGFKSASIDIDLHAGEVLRSSVTLEALSTDDLLAEVDREDRAGDLERAASAARLALAGDALNPKASLMLGQILYRQKKFDESTAFLGKAIDLGETVVLPMKHHHAGKGSDGLCEGFAYLTKSHFAFHSDTVSGHHVDVTANKILAVKNEPQKGARVNVRLVLQSGNTESEKDFNFQNPAAGLYPLKPDGRLVFVKCLDCDSSMDVFAGLLTKIRRR